MYVVYLIKDSVLTATILTWSWRRYLNVWNKSGVDLILIDSKNDVTVKNKTILAFFKKIKCAIFLEICIFRLFLLL